VDALGTPASPGSTSPCSRPGTALALDHFCRERVDVAVLEVGRGRLDATTVGKPRVVVPGPSTTIHQHELGDTLALIATEKAAIIRAAPPSRRGRIRRRRRSSRRAALAGRAAALEGRDLRVTPLGFT
jgi:dihydrofolate synthase/folylpolyglutamate synthase